ncbi:MAG: hypothetical protein AAGE84_09035 [Cyanobacteria bacterium P01_G01_bin.39]
MSDFLLDTHALIWLSENDSKRTNDRFSGKGDYATRSRAIAGFK